MKLCTVPCFTFFLQVNMKPSPQHVFPGFLLPIRWCCTGIRMKQKELDELSHCWSRCCRAPFCDLLHDFACARIQELCLPYFSSSLHLFGIPMYIGGFTRIWKPRISNYSTILKKYYILGSCNIRWHFWKAEPNSHFE